MLPSGPSAGIGGSAMGRHGCGAAITGRDDAADDGPATKIAQSRLRNRKYLVRTRSNAPILNQLSIFNTLDGRLGGLCGGGESAGMSSFFGEVGRDQGGTARPKRGLERRFSLVEVGGAEGAAEGTGGGGIRGS